MVGFGGSGGGGTAEGDVSRILIHKARKDPARVNEWHAVGAQAVLWALWGVWGERTRARCEMGDINLKTAIDVNMRGECRNRFVRPGMNRPYRAWVFYMHDTQPVGLGFY